MVTKLNSLDPKLPVWKHPYYPELENAIKEIQREFLIYPTLYFPEAIKYHHRAAHLQHRNLGWYRAVITPDSKCGDDLQDTIHIYDTIYRWSAGFSNVPQELMHQGKNPKHDWNKRHGLAFKASGFKDTTLMYLLLVHRVTGSGASFAKPGGKMAPHGWYNVIVPQLATQCDAIGEMRTYIRNYTKPMFSSIGNQVPSFNKPSFLYDMGGREYLCEIAHKLAIHIHTWLLEAMKPPSIQETVDEALRWQSSQGWRKFHFVLTAWAMDLAEYFPKLVNQHSDCYHGKNAQEALNLVFKPVVRMKRQDFFDRGTRAFANMFKTRPMDVEDAAPGCDLIRWLENYIRPGSYLDVNREKIFHKCYIKHPEGRQRWKVGTPDWKW